MKKYKNTFKAGLLIAAVLLLFAFRCNKDGTSCLSTRTTYSFTVTGKWFSEKEVYHIGDTLFFESSFPKTLTSLLNPSTVVDYSNSTGIEGGIGFGYMDTPSRQVFPAKDSFNFVSIIGSFYETTNNPNQGLNIKFQETAQNYHFKGAIICRKKGIYGFGVSDPYSNGIKGKNCTNADFIIKVMNANQHLYLHQYALGVDPNDAMLQRTGYDFRVQ